MIMRLPTLRRRIGWHVLLPLVLTWGLGTVITVTVANYYVQRAYDRSMVDDALSIASSVRAQGKTLSLNMSPNEIKHVLFDQEEKVYFAVLRQDGTLVAGHAGLRATSVVDGNPFAIVDIVFQGRTLRSVSLWQEGPVPFIVVLAQTRQSRDRLWERVLLLSVAPQLLLLLLLAWWLSRAIGRDLQPLDQLQQDLAQRQAHDLMPLAVTTSTRDLHRLGLALNDLLIRIQSSVQAQREFAGNVAHELRTPLAGIRAQAEYGLAHTEPEVWQTQLEGIKASQTRASHLVDQLLALALADETSAARRLEPLALDEHVQAAVLRYLPQADAAGVDIGAQGIDTPLRIQAQPVLIDGILNNLIDNALRYGGTHITVAVDIGTDALRLMVVDNGPGIAPEQQRLLTQRWVRGSSDQQRGQGAGLGLAIVGQYARSLGAVFELVSAEGTSGVCAVVRWSISPTPYPATPGAKSSPQGS